MPTPRTMALTSALVARVHRDIADPGHSVGLERLAEEDYEALVDDLLRPAHARDGVWVFAYGSLIWKPVWPVETQRPARLRGWHRAFCLRIVRFRGTPECPGLMMGLDRGGSCRGVLQWIPGPLVRQRAGELVRRELSVKPPTNHPRWVTVESGGERLPAIAFAIDRKGPAYAGAHSPEEIAGILARACGHWGSGAEYLQQTVAHLEALDIHDPYLWRLQELVARAIEATASGDRAAPPPR